MEYIRLFGTKSAHDTARSYGEGGEYKEPWVAYVDDGSNLVTYNKGWAEKYLTFEALEDTVFNVEFVKDSLTSSCIPRTMRESFSYSIDNGETWVTFETPNDTFDGIAITTPLIKSGEKVLWKGIGLQNFLSGPRGAYCHFTSTGDFNVYGNIMSLAYGDDFAEIEDLTNTTNIFSYFFKDCQHLISAESMVLPATTLADSCYYYMFNGCTALISAPELPATTLANSCYSSMFDGCTSLTTAPALPATTLAKDCYRYMFAYCTSLTAAPALPATTLADTCYNGMFYGCTSLTAAPELSVTTLTNNCYSYMFKGCTSLTTAPGLPATTLAGGCYASMFDGCTSLGTAPELPATTLANSCYSSMFQGCTSLTTTASELPAATLTDYCYNSMFQGCKLLTAAPELPATTLTSSCYNSMFNGCTSLTTAPELPATTLASGCYNSMFNGCTSLTTAPELPATTLASYCYSSMFSGCTALTTAPALTATTLANGCYSNMFADTRVLPDTSNIDFTSQSVISSGGLIGLFSKTIVTDSDLHRILPKNSQNKYCLPVTTLSNNCYRYMFQDCTALTTAPELPATTLAKDCYDYMFNGCTSLNYIKAMFTTKPSSTYTSNWVNGVASTGTFVKNSAATWTTTGANGIPTGWTVETASA